MVVVVGCWMLDIDTANGADPGVGIDARERGAGVGEVPD